MHNATNAIEKFEILQLTGKYDIFDLKSMFYMYFTIAW